jgi:hypothetical protein
MGTEMAPETSVIFNQLTRLSDFISILFDFFALSVWSERVFWSSRLSEDLNEFG